MNVRWLLRPQLYHGWWIVVTLAITETISWGVVYYAYSVIITPLEAEFGWSRAQVTGAFSLALLLSGGMAIPVGFWLDRRGARGLMTLGSIAATLLIAALAHIQTLSQLYLAWIGLGLAAATILYEPAFVVVTQWFDRRRSVALMVITLVAGFASTIFLPLTAYLVAATGWRGAMLWLALLLGVTTVPLHWLVLRRSPTAVGARIDGDDHAMSSTSTPVGTPALTVATVLRMPAFWWLVAALSLGTMAATGIRVHIIPLLEDRGFDPVDAAWIGGLIGAMQVFGRLLYAPVGGKVAASSVVAIIYGVQAAALVLLFTFTTLYGIWLFVIAFGAVYGAMTLARPAMLADQFGSKHYGRISSIQYVFQTMATTAAPYGIALLYTAFGNTYQVALLVLVALSALAALLVGTLGFVEKRASHLY